MPNDLTTMLSAFLTQLWAGNVTFPTGGTSFTENSSGSVTLGSNPTSTTTELRVKNGALPEYGQIGWNSNFLNVGTVTNGGTARNVRLIAASTSVILAPATIDAWVFGSTGATKLANQTTVGAGMPAIVANGRLTAQTAAQLLTTFTVGAADASFEISANILVTTATLHNFTVDCNFTDEGNTARTISFLFNTGSGFTTAIVNTSGAIPYSGAALHIRCKAASVINIRTQAAGTYTTVTYNGEGSIRYLG